MLYDIYVDAIRRKEALISSLKGEGRQRILSAAAASWIDYDPSPKSAISSGIDSSWNKKSYQGFDLFVVDSVSVTSDNILLEKIWEYNIGIPENDSLETKALLMESTVAKKTSDLVDIVIIDGSLSSRFVRPRKDVIESTMELLYSCQNIVFIAKSSESRNQFGPLGSLAGDIYYFSSAGKVAGYSVPYINKAYSPYTSITEIYARLKEDTPILKIEVACKSAESLLESEIKTILNQLCYHSVGGYPYCLKLAHKNCKISNDDMNRLASINGLSNDIGSRDALND